MIHLICLGNPLHADDGFGVAIAHRLGTLIWPETVRVLDGTKGGGAALFRGCDKAVVLHAFAPACGVPGQILRLPADVFPGDPPGAFGTGIAPLLGSVARLVQPAPDMEIMGPVSALAIPFAPGLSPLVAAGVETVAALLAREFGGRRHSGRRGGPERARRGLF